jgi:hypothetical protein
MAKAKNMTELRDQYLDIFEDSKKGLIRPADLKEKVNLFGKVVASAKVQLEQKVFLKEDTGVDFLKDE